MRYASSARLTCSASRSSSEYTATEAIPISSSARKTRIAISPRLATRTFLNMGAEPYGLFSHGACLTQPAPGHPGPMPALDRHHQAEARFLDLLAEAGFPAPDEIAHLRRCLIFLWE